jgi:hypothetical protein
MRIVAQHNRAVSSISRSTPRHDHQESTVKNCSTCLALALVFGLSLSISAADQKPVRMGCGNMTFDTVPGWGLGDDGKSVIGSTHGGVVVDKEGSIYTSSSLGVFVFSPDGKVIRRYLGPEYNNIHDMKINAEADGEFIYGARNANGEGIKFKADTGDIVMKLKFPEESGLNAKPFSPTARPPWRSPPTATSFWLTVMARTTFSSSTRRAST